MEKLSSIGEFIRQQREAAEVSVRELARLAGVSNPYLSQVERGLRKPSAEMLKQIARGLSVSAESLYIRAGLLEAEPDLSHTSLAVEVLSNDASLTPTQRSELIDRYQEFQIENSQSPNLKGVNHD